MISSFALRLVTWQKKEGRHDLPWQKTLDPYRIWLSEIMLQQTQVNAVIPYYQRFLARFPDLAALAAADQSEVLEAWAGLGYYARGRNLHRTAQQVMREFEGVFPSDPAILTQLPGIGRSTAAAIAVFAFGAHAAILDGNVKRVLCRHAGIEGFPGLPAVERKLWALAESQLPEQDVQAYTQGLMDLGATLCLRRQPTCAICPLSEDCVAFKEGRQAMLPSSKVRAKLPQRSATFVLITDGNTVLLQRRPPSGIWGGLLAPPEGEPEKILAQRALVCEEPIVLSEVKHSFTHFQLTICPVVCRVNAISAGISDPCWHWQELSALENAALPTPVRKILREMYAAILKADAG